MLTISHYNNIELKSIEPESLLRWKKNLMIMYIRSFQLITGEEQVALFILNLEERSQQAGPF